MKVRLFCGPAGNVRSAGPLRIVIIDRNLGSRHDVLHHFPQVVSHQVTAVGIGVCAKE